MYHLLRVFTITADIHIMLALGSTPYSAEMASGIFCCCYMATKCIIVSLFTAHKDVLNQIQHNMW